MSNFLRHEPCPECGSRDNLGVWDDGHTYCFGCGYYTTDTSEFAKRLWKQSEQHTASEYLALPSDSTHVLPPIATSWLNKYNLSAKEKSGFSWSDKYESLIYSVFDVYGNLVLFQRRYFGKEDFPRFCTKGKRETLYHVIGSNDRCITLVEDIISALKVGRHTAAMPLWGSNISSQRITRLSQMYPNVNIWLDKDKCGYAVMARQRAAPFFHQARCIISELDPKQYNDESIQEFLSNES